MNRKLISFQIMACLADYSLRDGGARRVETGKSSHNAILGDCFPSIVVVFRHPGADT